MLESTVYEYSMLCVVYTSFLVLVVVVSGDRDLALSIGSQISKLLPEYGDRIQSSKVVF
jgi:hypothetical protein